MEKEWLYFHTKKGIQEETFFVMTLEDKSLSAFPYWIAPMSIEKAWRPTWHYKTLLKRSETVATKQLSHSSSEASLCYLWVTLTCPRYWLAFMSSVSVTEWKVVYWCVVLYIKLLLNQISHLQKLCSFKERLYQENMDETPKKHVWFQSWMERIKIQWWRHKK